MTDENKPGNDGSSNASTGNGKDTEAEKAAAQPGASGSAAAEPGMDGVPEPVVAPPDPVAVLTTERDRLKDGLLRALADLDNYRKRARKDSDEAVRKAREDLIREFLPVFDNLERAAQYVESGADPKAVGKGIEMVLRLFEDTLAKLGGKRLRPVGSPFDPSHHEAIQQMESAEHPAGTVAQEAVAGYLFNDRLLRPAMVVVSKGAPSGEPSKGDREA